MNPIIKDIGVGVLVAIVTAYVIRSFPAVQRLVVGGCNCPGAAPGQTATGAVASSGAILTPQPVMVGNAGPWSPAVGIGSPVSVPLSGVPDPMDWFSDQMTGRGIWDTTGAG